MPEYDIQFSRNKTDQGFSSLSSLNIPANLASSTSFSVLSNGTPREHSVNRKSSLLPRRSGPSTPAQMIRQKQLAMIDIEKQNKQPKKSLNDVFKPQSSSTPIRSQINKKSMYDELTRVDKPENELVDSESEARASDKHDTQTHSRNTSTPIHGMNRTLTPANQIDDSEPTLVPDTQHRPDESVIPETQDDQTIPETQDDQVIPETQEDRIPETQESYTQNDSVADPVQAQVISSQTFIDQPNCVDGFKFSFFYACRFHNAMSRQSLDKMFQFTIEVEYFHVRPFAVQQHHRIWSLENQFRKLHRAYHVQQSPTTVR